MDVTLTTSGPIVFPRQLMFCMVMLIKVTWQLEQLCLHLVIPCSQIPQKKRPAAEIISVNGDCCCIIATQSSNIFMEHLGYFSQKWPWTLMPTVTLVYYDETFYHETDLIKWMPFPEAQFCDLISSIKPQQISRKCWSTEIMINFSWMVVVDVVMRITAANGTKTATIGTVFVIVS